MSISIRADNDEQVLFSQNINCGEVSTFTLDNVQRELNISVTPIDMYSTSIELKGKKGVDNIEYEAILQNNEIKLKEVQDLR